MILQISGIPRSFTSSDLRNYFSGFIENGYFECFHYRHRPDTSTDPTKYCCCLLKIAPELSQKFIKSYHSKYWIDRQGLELEDKCLLKAVIVEDQGEDNEANIDGIDSILVTSKVLSHPELKTSKETPHGNVGTPTKVFLDLISKCELPSAVIRRLGLQFSNNRSRRKYSKVPYDYGSNSVDREHGSGQEIKTMCTGSGMELSSRYLGRRPLQPSPPGSPERPFQDQEESSSEDDDRGEEWDRHESLTNDVTAQERTKERLYEEEMEVVWEKGGSGLVFYTDAQYWAGKEADFDEQTADDFDVDMSVYYEPGGGDKDSKDFLEMRRAQMLREGRNPEDLGRKFRSPQTSVNDERKSSSKSAPSASSAMPTNSLRHSTELTKTQIKKMKKAAKRAAAGGEKFEDRVLGKARKMMQSKGWKQGDPLGDPRQEGLIYPLESEGQGPWERKGFGYHGEVLPREKKPRTEPSRPSEDGNIEERIITTIYDQPNRIDPLERLDRSDLPTKIKHRKVS